MAEVTAFTSSALQVIYAVGAHKKEPERFDPTATLIRIHQVISLTGIGRATVYKLMTQPESGFPQSVKLTESNARGAPVAWVLSEVLAWTRARIAARDNEAA